MQIKFSKNIFLISKKKFKKTINQNEIFFVDYNQIIKNTSRWVNKKTP
jgi:hypothetical protein